MITSRKYRLYPNKEQKTILDLHFNAVRLIYNLALETKNLCYYSYGKNLSRYDLQVQLKDCKNEFPWLKDINSQSLQSALMHLDASFTNFFRQLKNGNVAKRKESYIQDRNKKGLNINWDKYHSIGKPKFKSKKDTIQSFHIPQNFNLYENKLFIPKLKSGIKTIVSQDIIGDIRNATISKTNTGKYYVSIIIEDKISHNLKPEVIEQTTTGVDLGIKSFAVCSNGEIFNNPKFLKKSINRLKILNGRFSKKKNNSKNKNKQRLKISKIHEKVANQRKDFLHKTSTAIIKQCDTVVVESLSIKNMLKNHTLAQSISDVGWAKFNVYLKYKSYKYNKNYIEIDRFFPSSKMHNLCGYVNKELTLKDREWDCPICKTKVDRDLNAAMNIKLSGLGQSVEPFELPAIAGALKKEAI